MNPTGIRPFGLELTPWVKRLIAANAVVFVLIFAGAIPMEFAVEYLGFNVSQAWREPWTIISYMFVHGGFLHLFLNMLMLFFFGPPLERRWGGKEFITYYAICGVGGALFTLVFGGGTIIGASGAIYGVMLAYALNWPDNLIWIYAIFPIKAKYLVLILGAISFFSAFAGPTDGIAHLAHLGGLVVGFVYLKKGWELAARGKDLRKRWRARRLRVIPGGKDGAARARRRAGAADEEARLLEIVDRLLDKIGAEGLDSLTPEERRFLDEVSRRRQTSQQEVRH
ncbi:MAG: rhomboid family intramembrane serine protease [Gemmatimonadota bacterium]|nr:MAG: rhomboid family intramembrane serine protease [Gemmatimonadota bacterium]